MAMAMVMNSLEVKILLVSEEQQPHVQLDADSIESWPSLQLLDAQKSTHFHLLAALQTACNLRRRGNLWGFLPEGLPSEYYDLRSDSRRKFQTSYLLVQTTDRVEATGSSRRVVQNLSALAVGPKAQRRPMPYDTAAGSKIAIVVIRRSCNYCSNPVHQHSESERLKLARSAAAGGPSCSPADGPTVRLKVHALCAFHRSKQESKKVNYSTGRLANKLVIEGHAVQTKSQKETAAPVELARRLSFIASHVISYQPALPAVAQLTAPEVTPVTAMQNCVSTNDSPARHHCNEDYNSFVRGRRGDAHVVEGGRKSAQDPTVSLDGGPFWREGLTNIDMDAVFGDMLQESSDMNLEISRQVFGSNADDLGNGSSGTGLWSTPSLYENSRDALKTVSPKPSCTWHSSFAQPPLLPLVHPPPSPLARGVHVDTMVSNGPVHLPEIYTDPGLLPSGITISDLLPNLCKR